MKLDFGLFCLNDNHSFVEIHFLYAIDQKTRTTIKAQQRIIMAKRGAALPDIKNIDDLDKFLEVKCLVGSYI